MPVPPVRKAEAEADADAELDTPVATSPLVLVALLAVCLGMSAIGGAITASSVDTWYPTLNKPAFTPPNWLFAPVWTTLYVLMAVAAWRIWGQRRRVVLRGATICFFGQLALNLTWTVVFFGLRDLDAALFTILSLVFAVAVTTVVFLRIDRLAGLLFVPYLGWTAFATFLMVEIWRLNPP